ncbi:MAG: HPr family phosphocarrier protein [Planctomycetota bacterium]|jgi:phosphotransferase system HPr (HPr) family protein
MTQTQSREVVIREEEFGRLLADATREFSGWANAVLDEPELLGIPAVMVGLGQRAHALETFLDDYGARQNRTFVILGELTASVRGLAGVKATALHLSDRLPRYQVLVETGPLAANLSETRAFLDRAIIALFQRLQEEASQWGFGKEIVDVRSETPVLQRRLLPRNLDEVESVDERQHIAEIGAQFLKVLETSRSLDLGFERPRETLAEFVASHATEERCRWYESTVHSMQSMYDTYVLHTSVERDHPWLQALRGHASIALHLLEMATGLMHFYERHENDIRHEGARDAIAAVVPKQDTLHAAVNVCLRHAYLFVEGASATAHQILNTFVRQARLTLSMPAGVTFHARPLALIVQVARHYGTPLEISFDGERASATSLMGLIMLGGRHPRPKAIDVRGDARALRDLESLFAWGLGEHGGEPPAGLEYLRIRS